MCLTQQQLSFVCAICCEFFYLQAKQCVSSPSAHSLHVSVSSYSLEMGRHVNCMGPMAPTPRSRASRLQNLRKIAIIVSICAAKKMKKRTFAQSFIVKCALIVQQLMSKLFDITFRQGNAFWFLCSYVVVFLLLQVISADSLDC